MLVKPWTRLFKKHSLLCYSQTVPNYTSYTVPKFTMSTNMKYVVCNMLGLFDLKQINIIRIKQALIVLLKVIGIQTYIEFVDKVLDL